MQASCYVDFLRVAGECHSSARQVRPAGHDEDPTQVFGSFFVWHGLLPETIHGPHVVATALANPLIFLTFLIRGRVTGLCSGGASMVQTSESAWMRVNS